MKSPPTFRLSPHSIREGVEIVEVFIDGVFVASIAPLPGGIHIVSAKFDGEPRKLSGGLVTIPSVLITFDEKRR